MKHKRFLSLFTAAAMLISLLPTFTLTVAAETVYAGDFAVTFTSGAINYDGENHILTISGGGEYTIEMDSGVTSTTDIIKVDTSDDVTITLAGVNITSEYGSVKSPFEIAEGGNITVKLSGKNTLTSESGANAGLQLTNANLVITSVDGDSKTTGSLDATGGTQGAGIGSGINAGFGSITIKGGTITAVGNTYSAGIGGGCYGSGTVTVTGGDVTAYSNGGGAGIGGGSGGSDGIVTITGGTVNASSNAGAGIGDGQASDGTITVSISGGYISVSTDNSNADYIGSGYLSTSTDTVTITGGYFADSGYSSSTVYGCTVASGCEVYANADADTSGTYPCFVAAAHTHYYDTDGFCTTCGAYQPADYDSENDVYEISNVGQLFWFASLVNGDTTQEGITAAVSDANAILTDDIDLESKEWTPIGDYGSSISLYYGGLFDGDGHSIEGLYINSTNNVQGLFGYVKGGTVQNVTVSGSVTGNYNVGGVVGGNFGTVINCYNSGSINGTNYIGGVVGSNDGTVTNCCNSGSINGTGYVGGVVGYNTGDNVKNCINSGTVSGTGSVGGVVGYNDKYGGSVSNCYYLEGTATAAIGQDSGTSTDVLSKTLDEFESGEVTYLLNGGVTDGTQAWYQTLGTDSYPVLDSTHGTVYYATACDGSYADYYYSNRSAIHAANTYDGDGFCINCGAYEPVKQNSEGIYIIITAGQLFWFASLVNGDTTQAGITAADTGANAVLLNDITIPSGYEWTPIGTKSAPYTGTFDGGEHEIKGLSITTEAEYLGLFGYVSEGTVKDLTVSGEINVSGDTIFAGGIVGTIRNGVLSNLTSNVNVTGYTTAKGTFGGVAATVESTDGSAGSTMELCENLGQVSASGVLDCTGGLVGYMNSATITNCENRGEVDTTGATAQQNAGVNTGGIVGYINNKTAVITNCINIGEVSNASSTSTMTCYTGAVVGRIRADLGEITNVYYLDTSADADIGENEYSKEVDITAQTAAEFATGAAAWSLQNVNTDYVWGQRITGSTTDAYPVLTSDTTKWVVRVAFYKVSSGTVADTPFAYGYTNIGQIISDYPDDAEYTFYLYQDLTGQVDTTTKTYSADTSVYAYVVPNKYTVKWFDEDGTLLETYTDVEEGTTPSYSGETPTKMSNGLYIYTFSGWSPEVGAITADTNYTAQYSRTYVAPSAGEGYTIDYSAETAAAANSYESYELSADGSTWSSTLTVIPSGTLYVRKATDTMASASAATANTLADRPSAPSVTAVDEQWQGENDGQITGVTTAMEYSTDAATWTACTGTTVDNLAADTYYVRYKATDSAFASMAASVTIASGTERTYDLTVTAPTFSDVDYDYAQPNAASIIITNTGNSGMTISEVAVNSANFTIGGSGSTVTAGDTITTWTIQPVAGLNVGTYTDTITVKYNGGEVTAAVSFTVNKATPSVTVPSGITATYGDTLSNVTLDSGWSWVDSTSSVGDAGTKTFAAVYTPADTDNYNTVAADISVTVAARPIEVTWDYTSFVYDGSEKTVTPTITNIVGDDSVSITYSGNTATAVGSYTAEVSAVSNTNYTLTGATGLTNTWSIVQSATGGDVKTYNGSTATNAFTYGENITVKATLEVTGTASGLTVSAFTPITTAMAAVFNGETQISDAVAVTNGTETTLTVDTTDLGASDSAYTLTLKYYGDDNMATTELDFDVTVAKATPDYTKPTGLTATYGDTLSSVKLPDGWTWVDENTSVGDVGTHEFEAKYTPSDTANYTTVTVDVSVTVSKTKPAYEVPSGLTAVYGDTLNDVTLPAGWTWETPTASVGNVGTNTFSATYTPDDTANYESVTVNVSITVEKAEPTYTVPTGLTATYGDTLSTVTLPDNWTWADATSSVGDAGDNTFTAVYTPEDSANYNTATADVIITVAKAEQSAPSNLTVTQPDEQTSTGTITGVTTDMEYSLDGGDTWEDITDDTLIIDPCTVLIRYAENNNYNASAAVEIEISAANPSYTTPTDLTAVYGDILADVDLPTADNGVWTWENENTSVGNAGTNTFTSIFTPYDDNYNTVYVEISVTVAKAEPDYTEPTGLTATYGDTLATVALPDGWAWAEANTSVGNAGTNTFTAVFTPEDSTNYETITAEIDVTVGKATPTYDLPTGLTATYGDTLASVELPDGWTWVDENASVGDVGTHEFAATFSPDDTDNYETVAAEISVTVTAADEPEPSEEPTETPTEEPTEEPTETPTEEPTEEPAELVVDEVPMATRVKRGNALSTSTLSGGSVTMNGTEISGTWAWADGTQTFTKTGTYDCTAIFTADDETYGTIEATVTVTVYTSSSGSSGGGSTSGTTTYTVTAEESENGSITTSSSKSASNATVTITVTPNDGYAADTVAVTDASGNDIEVTANDDGTYSFTMPSSKVSISASFKEAEAEPTTEPTTEPTDDTHDCPSEKFTDVDTTLWYHEYIDYVLENGLMNGTGDTTFEPNTTTTRAMIVTILYRLEGEPTVTNATVFTDVAAGDWYADAVAWAAENGIVLGYGDGTFGADDVITREQTAAILYRYADYKGEDMSVGEDTNILSYTDADEISEYAIPAMQWAIGSGLVTSKGDNVLDPQGGATRAETAAMLMRFIETE